MSRASVPAGGLTLRGASERRTGRGGYGRRMDRTLLLVTGAGRSGTSTIAGALSLLGVNVPGPFLEANASNPKGFYESRWSVQFHNRLLKRANVSIADGRPDARAHLRAAITPKHRAELREWIDEITRGHRLTVVKDPRTTWTLDLWKQVTDELGVDLVSLTMLRHPAEVIGSRATHYAAGAEAMGAVGYAVRNLAGWTNALPMTEQQTRGWRRTFVRYDDLLTDWRQAVGSALSDLGVEIDQDLTSGDRHPVDDFIDPNLSRHPLTWDDVEVQPELRTVADAVWDACSRLADQHAHDEQAEKALDVAAVDYADLYLAARQLVHDAIAAEAGAARKAGAQAARRRLQEGSTGDRAIPRVRRARALAGRLGRAARRLRRRTATPR